MADPPVRTDRPDHPDGPDPTPSHQLDAARMTRSVDPGRPALTLVQGGRANAPASFIVAPLALLRLDRTVTAEEIDMLRCRRLHPASGTVRAADTVRAAGAAR